MSVADVVSMPGGGGGNHIDVDRTPPQDIVAEQCVLGGMLLSKDAIADVVEVIKPTDFYRPAHQTVYDAILDLYGKGEPVGAMDVIGKHVRGLHAKDGHYPTNPKELGKEVAIGKGRVDFPELIRRLRKINYTGPITIEREISGPEQESDIRASIAFLNKLIDQSYGS